MKDGKANSGLGAAVEPTLSVRTARGMGWLLLQTLGSRVVNLGGQWVLAWLLAPADFGLLGLALSVTSFATLIQTAGLEPILIQRFRHYTHWAAPAFWLSLATGLLAMGLTLAASPLAAWAYGAPTLIQLLGVLALASPIEALGAVARAKLRARMRFDALAAVNLAGMTIQTLLTIGLADAGFGALSFAIPRPSAAGLMLLAFWRLANPPRPRLRNLSWRRTRLLLTPAGQLTFSGLFLVVVHQGDYIVLGLFADPTQVGLYFFAFSLAMQTYGLLTRNLANVLMPALSTLANDPPRQVRAMMRATRLLAILAMPTCGLQALLAEPIILSLFESKWLPAIVLVQILSVGLALRVVGSTAGAMMQAQGRFALVMKLRIIYGIVFLTLVTLGGWLGGTIGVAVAATLHFAGQGVTHLYMAVRGQGVSSHETARVFATPAMLAAIACLAAAGVAWQLPDMAARTWAQIGVMTVVTAATYVVLLAAIAPQDLKQIRQRLGDLRQRNPAPKTPPTP